MKIEDVYLHLAAGSCTKRNCLIVFDRGTMDGSACLPFSLLISMFSKTNSVKISVYADIEPQLWQRILLRNGFNAVDLRDNRYDQIVHMVMIL